MNKIKILLALCIIYCTLLIGTAGAQDFGIYDLSAKTNLDTLDQFMLSQKADSTYYKVYWDRIVDSVEDSIRGSIINSWIKSTAAIALSKLATGTAAYFVVNNVSGVPTYVAMSGDATLSNAGVVTISANAVGSSEITDNTIATGDILDGTVGTADIENESITTTDIDDGTIANADISASAEIALTKLANGSIAEIIITDDMSDPVWVTVSGDITIASNGAVDLADALADNFSYTGSSSYTPEDFTPSGSTTLSASGVKVMLCQLDANSATITDFTSGTNGQEITVINSNTSTFSFVIDHGAEIITNTQADKTIAPGETITFVYVSATDLWYEIGQ